jgi:hypothetical protein
MLFNGKGALLLYFVRMSRIVSKGWYSEILTPAITGETSQEVPVQPAKA